MDINGYQKWILKIEKINQSLDSAFIDVSKLCDDGSAKITLNYPLSLSREHSR